MSSFTSLTHPRNVVLYIRTCPGERTIATADFQEDILRQFCLREHLSVCAVIRHACTEAETIPFLDQLLQELPLEADSMLAWRFSRYSSNLTELSRICFLYEYYGIVLYSMEFSPCLWRALPTVHNPYDPNINDGIAIPLPPVKNRVRRK